jgi:hypothetical protein
MSRGQPPKSTSPVRLAHIEFVAALAGNVPHLSYTDIDSEDLDGGGADHLERVFAALSPSIGIGSSAIPARHYAGAAAGPAPCDPL